MRGVIHSITCGIDVQKDQLACTIVIADSIQVDPVYQHRKFATHNYGLVKLAE